MSDTIQEFGGNPDINVRGHHLDLLKIYGNLQEQGFILTEDGCHYHGQLVRGNKDLEELLHNTVKAGRQFEQYAVKSGRQFIEKVSQRNPDKSYPWGDERVSYMSDAYNYLEPRPQETLKQRVLNLIHINHEEHSAETPLERFLNKASLEAKTEVMTRLYLAPPDELVSINAYSDDICATCPIGLHCSSKDIGKIAEGPNIDVPHIESFIEYTRKNDIPLKAVFFSRFNGEDVPTEVITTMGDIRKFVLSEDTSISQ